MKWDGPRAFMEAVKKYLSEKGLESEKSIYTESGSWGSLNLQAIRKIVFYELVLPEMTRLAYKYKRTMRYAWVGVRSVNLMDANDYANLVFFFGNMYPGDPNIYEVTEVVREEDLK